MLYYKTKKYILRSVFYAIIALVVVSVYIIAAHNHRLIVLLERFNGEFVRKHTKPLYDSFFGEKQQIPATVAKEKNQKKLLWNALDTITLDENYLQVRSKLNAIKQSIAQLPYNRKEFLRELAVDSTIKLYLQNPQDPNADIFRYEILRKIESLPYVSSFAILDLKENPLVKTANYSAQPMRYDTSKERDINEVGFYQVIRVENQVVAVAYGHWNYWKFPDLPYIADMGKNFSGIIIDKNSQVLSDVDFLPPHIQNDIQDGKYQGYHNARVFPYRYLSMPVHDAQIIVVTSATSLVFYVYRLLLYFLFIVLGFYVFVIAKKIIPQLNLRQYLDSPKLWLDKGVEEAVELNRQAIQLAHDSQQLLVEAKQQELQLLNSISENIAKIKVYQKSKLLGSAYQRHDFSAPPQDKSSSENPTKQADVILPQVVPVYDEVDEDDFLPPVSPLTKGDSDAQSNEELMRERPSRSIVSLDEEDVAPSLVISEPKTVEVKPAKNDDWVIANDNHANESNKNSAEGSQNLEAEALKGSDLEVADGELFLTLDYEEQNRQDMNSVNEPKDEGTDEAASSNLAPVILESAQELDVEVIDELDEPADKSAENLPNNLPKPLFDPDDIDLIVDDMELPEGADAKSVLPKSVQEFEPLFDEDEFLSNLIAEENPKKAPPKNTEEDLQENQQQGKAA